MWKRLGGTVLPLVAIVALVAGSAAGATRTGQATSAASARTFQCTSRFVATIRQGPDSGHALKGQLVFTAGPGGRVGGALLANAGKQVTPVTGSLVGRSFKLFVPVSGGTIMGIGQAAAAVNRCADVPHAGTFTGPRPGDKGDWDTIVVTECHYIFGIQVYCRTVTIQQ